MKMKTVFTGPEKRYRYSFTGEKMFRGEEEGTKGSKESLTNLLGYSTSKVWLVSSGAVPVSIPAIIPPSGNPHFFFYSRKVPQFGQNLNDDLDFVPQELQVNLSFVVIGCETLLPV